MAAPSQESPILVAFTLDFETGDVPNKSKGSSPANIAITQIALHATRLDTFERIGSYVSYVKPYYQKTNLGPAKKRKVLKSKFENEEQELMIYTQEALEYSAITMDMLETYGKPIETVAQEALQFIIDSTPKCPRNLKPFLLGQNIDFDKGFFLQLFEYTGLINEIQKYLRGTVDFYGNWQPLVLDTIILGQLALCHLPNINSYKLEIMCEHLGVDLDDAHDADADVTATTNVAAVLTQRMRSIGGEYTGDDLAVSKAEKSRKHFKI